MSVVDKTKLDEVNENLDKILVEFFETLGELYKEQANMEDTMKNGFLMLSRARYNMGAKSVGISQYNEKNMKASKVLCVNSENDNVSKMFELVNPSDYPTESFTDKDSGKDNSGLRQRKGETVETIGSNDELSTKNVSNSQNKTDNDPIKWFGVLVPQSLRQSQSYFQRSIDAVVSVSNLKSKVVELKDKYKSLMKEKHTLVS